MENNDTNPTSPRLRGTRKIMLVSGVLVLILGIFLVVKNVSLAPILEENSQASSTETSLGKIKIDPVVNLQTLPLSNNPKDVAWAVFSKYLAFNKEQNLAGVKSVVYKINPVCADEVASAECKARMKSAYNYGNTLKKADLVNIWSDEKQMILATDFWVESVKELDQYGRFRGIIFFVKDESGDWKLLSFSPTKGGATNKGSASQAEIDARLIRYTEDEDRDGLADYEEECLNKPNDSTCVKTSPKLRDTNGNGLWDGVEALMK